VRDSPQSFKPPGKTASPDNGDTGSPPAKLHGFVAIAQIQIDSPAANLWASVSHRVNPVVSRTQTSEPDYRAQWHHLRVGGNHTGCDPRTGFGDGSPAIRGDGESG